MKVKEIQEIEAKTQESKKDLVELMAERDLNNSTKISKKTLFENKFKEEDLNDFKLILLEQRANLNEKVRKFQHKKLGKIIEIYLLISFF